MAKKYTMNEFRDLFNKAKLEVIEEDSKENNSKMDDPMTRLIASMLTVTAISKLENKLFKEEEE